MESNSVKPERNLIDLPKESAKGCINPEKVKKVYEEKFGHIKNLYTSNLNYLKIYHYGSESVEDYSWGCVWRALQTTLWYLLSINGRTSQEEEKALSFKEFFMKYGRRDKLEELYRKAYNYKEKDLPTFITKGKFPPFELSNGFAEPFICKLAISDYGFKSQLILVNGYPEEHANSPKEVFEKTVFWEEFKEILVDHFKTGTGSPVIIDDGLLGACIDGISEKEDGTVLVILDPHIWEKMKGEEGIYYVTLNKDGSYNPKKNPQKNISGYRFDFKKVRWMALIPESK